MEGIGFGMVLGLPACVRFIRFLEFRGSRLWRLTATGARRCWGLAGEERGRFCGAQALGGSLWESMDEDEVGQVARRSLFQGRNVQVKEKKKIYIYIYIYNSIYVFVCICGICAL